MSADVADLIAEGIALANPQQKQAVLLQQGQGAKIRAHLEEKAGRKGTNMYCVGTYDGKEITRHDHPEDVILFYPKPEGVPVIMEDEDGNETATYPEPGDVVFVPKGVWHRVPPNNTGKLRVSIALKLED
jgi:quercetin dioxygenase-like cupin family protein